MKKQDIQSIDISYVEGSELPHRVRFSDGTASGIDGSGITLGHALFAAVQRVDTWIHIDPADPGTLPPDIGNSTSMYVLLSIFDNDNDSDMIIEAWYDYSCRTWCQKGVGILDVGYGPGTIIPVGWMPWPEALPYKEQQ